MNYITFSHATKTYAFTSKEVAQAMIAMGNPYGHDRALYLGGNPEIISSLNAQGFKEV
jgi:hypothetical protein